VEVGTNFLEVPRLTCPESQASDPKFEKVEIGSDFLN